MSSSRSSTGRSRARATAPPASVSRRRGAVLAGKGGLENVVDLVLVQTVVRRRRRGFRPDTGDAEIPGELTAASRNGRSLALRRAAEIREKRAGCVEVGHRLAELGRDELGSRPGQISVRGVRLVQDPREAVRALRGIADDPACRLEIDAVLFRRDRRNGRRHRPPRSVWRRLHHANAVVRGPRREGWPLAESVLKGVGDRYRPRRARLLAHEARLALEDARLRLEQKSDEPPRPFGQIALLIRIFPSDGLRMDEVLEGPEHARDDAKHLESILDLYRCRSTEGPRAMGHRPEAGGSLSRREGFGRPAAQHDHRSTSPRTMSIEPRMATASATRRSFSNQGRICKFTNDGPRIFARNGFGLRPSLIM